jgi:hypothetical protein
MRTDALPAREARARPGFSSRTLMTALAAVTFLVAMLAQNASWQDALIAASEASPLDSWLPPACKAIVFAAARCAWQIALVALAWLGGAPLPGWIELATLLVGVAFASGARTAS